MRVVYVNGDYLPENQAKISIFDRGFLFADAVYEVVSVLEGKLVDFPGHMARLRRSLQELSMSLPLSDKDLLAIHRKLVALNALDEGLVYLQVSRGAADRDFLFLEEGLEPTVVLFTQARKIIDAALAARGQRIMTVLDHRWRRCDIKTVQLLYPSLAKTLANRQGADDVWMVLDGFVTEGSSNNAFIVPDSNKIVTRDLSNEILHGVTRRAVLKCARELGIKVEERKFTVEDAKTAREAFSTSATGFVCPVVQIDDAMIGDGSPGLIASQLRQIYIDESRAAAL
ncbi:MAG: D-amino-acid transaminase [Hyphomicrobiales bacterium]